MAVNDDPSLYASTVLMSMDAAATCLMTPPRQPLKDASQWTPTANLKLLLKAASPDLHSREVSHSLSDVPEVSHSHSDVPEVHPSETNMTVPDVADVNECSMHSGSDVLLTADNVAENVTISVDKGRRKDKSLGLLCER